MILFMCAIRPTKIIRTAPRARFHDRFAPTPLSASHDHFTRSQRLSAPLSACHRRQAQARLRQAQHAPACPLSASQRLSLRRAQLTITRYPLAQAGRQASSGSGSGRLRGQAGRQAGKLRVQGRQADTLRQAGRQAGMRVAQAQSLSTLMINSHDTCSGSVTLRLSRLRVAQAQSLSGSGRQGRLRLRQAGRLRHAQGRQAGRQAQGGSGQETR